MLFPPSPDTQSLRHATALLAVIGPLAQRDGVHLEAAVAEAGIPPADPAQLLHNPLSNAVQFTPEGGGGARRERAHRPRGSGAHLRRVRAVAVGGKAGPRPGPALRRVTWRPHLAGSTPGEGSRLPFTLPLDVPPPAAVAPDPPDRPTTVPARRSWWWRAAPARTSYCAAPWSRAAITPPMPPAVARRLQPAAITLDLALADRDGWRLLRQFKAGAGTRAIPTVVVSMEDDEQPGYALGAAGCPVKPVDRAVLLEHNSRVAPPARPLPVLAVDDDPAVRALLQGILAPAGRKVLEAADGAPAPQLARRAHPDLLPPHISGFALRARLRSAAAAPLCIGADPSATERAAPPWTC